MKKLLTLLSLVAFFVTALAVQTFAQRTITGVVTDAETREPLIGATITAKGTATGTVTDFDGSYSLELPEGATILVFSYTGYTAQEITVSASDVINLELAAGTALDEVVVVGYGTVRKRDLTGSVASLKSEDFNQGVMISSDQLLQGRVPGVNIVNNSGQPGGQATVKIRGNNSIRAGAEPLYVIDGVPLDGRTAKAGLVSTEIGNIENSNPLNFLNPADIASIEVLKDASSAAIFGSRASNGVVLITTKKARPGETQVSFNSNWGISNVLKEYETLNGDQYRDALNQYGVTTGGDGGASSDAFDAITRTAFVQNYNLSVGTGGENSRVRFSAGIQDVEGIVDQTDLIRYSATLNAQYEFFDDRAGIDFFVVSSHTDENLAPISTDAGFTGNLVGQALQWNPTIPLTTSSGAFTTGANNPLVGNTTINPLQLLSSHNELAKTTNILGSISPYFKITDKLTYRYRFGINYGTGTTRGNIGAEMNIEDIEGFGFAGVSNNQLLTNLHTHTLDFNTDIGNNFLSLLVGYEYQKFDFRGFAFAGFGFDDVPVGFDLTNALQNAANDRRLVFSFADPITELQSYFARAVVGLGERFDITATVRVDGSTKFGDNNALRCISIFCCSMEP
ncbi:MAG: SusC/RagA family TonB-linked outer membrane protein [Bacteroidota bacterium]